MRIRGIRLQNTPALVSLFFIIMTYPCFAFAEEYSLYDLFRIALTEAERLRITEEDLRIAQYGKEKAESVLFPKISTFGSYIRYSDNKRTSTGIVIQPDESTSWGLRLDQSLSLSGREITALNISRYSIEMSRYDIQAAKEEYLLTVATSYYNVLKAKKALEIAVANLQRLTRHRDAANIRLRAGEITKTDLLRAEAETSGARAEIARAENNLKIAKAVLARIAGLKGDFEIIESLASDSSDLLSVLSLNSLRQIAISERPELKAVEIQKRIAAEQVRYTKGAYWPSLTIQGMYLRREEDPASLFLNRESLYGGITLNLPLFEGGLRNAEVREMMSRLKQAELIYEDKKKTVGIDIERAYLDLITQKEVIKSLEDQLRHAKDNYKTVSRQYELGLANSIDVIDANTLYLTSERQLSEARYDYELALIRLERAAGILLKKLERQ